MEWIREWVFRVTAVIVIGSVCDMVLLEGSLKKYVKPVLGIVLILSIIRPVAYRFETDFAASILKENDNVLPKVIEETKEAQVTYIADMYEEKLNKKIEEEVSLVFNLKSSVSTKTNKEKGSFGCIEKIDITILSDLNEGVNTENIRQHIAKSFGIEKQDVEVASGERGEDLGDF